MSRESRRIHPFRTALGVSAAAVLLLFLTMYPRFETNDDMTIATLVNGARIISDPHLVYQNYLLGVLLKLLYRLPLLLPWYTLVQYAALATALTAVAWVLIRRGLGERAGGLLVCLLLTIFLGYQTMILVQYTRTAGVCAASGGLLIWEGLRGERCHKKAVLTGILLGCAAFCLRSMEAAACLLLMLPPGILYLPHPKECLSFQRLCARLSFLAAPFLCLGVLWGALSLLDQVMYRTDPVWREYREFNEARTELLDYGFPDYAANEQVYRELGIDQTAFALFRGWNYADPEVFTTQACRRLISLKPAKRFGRSFLLGFFREISKGLMRENGAVFALFALALFLISGRRGRRSLIGALMGAGLFFLLQLWLYWRGRYLVNRVDFGLWVGLGLSLLFLSSSPENAAGASAGYFLPSGAGRRARRQGILLCLSALLSGGLLCLQSGGALPGQLKFGGREERALRRYQKRREAFLQIAEDSEHLYLAKVGTISTGNCFGPLDKVPEGLMANLCYLGGWAAYTGPYMETMKKWDITNPYRDMIGREDILLIDDEIDLTVEYLRAHYSEWVEAEQVFSLGKYEVYRIRLGSEDTLI